MRFQSEIVMSPEREDVVLAEIHTMTRACYLAWQSSGIPGKELSARMGIGYEHFTRMMNEGDSRHFPIDLLPALCTECKSILPLEWFAWRMGFKLHTMDYTNVLDAIREVLCSGGRQPKFSMRQEHDES
jgi:hypothetical protein